MEGWDMKGEVGQKRGLEAVILECRRIGGER